MAAAPVIREMLIYGQRWPISRASSDSMADSFFETLAHLVLEWLDRETPLCLPTSTDPLVAAVMNYTNTHLQYISAQDVCHSVGVSERSLRRAFPAATGMSWRQYLLESRLLPRHGSVGRTGAKRARCRCICGLPERERIRPGVWPVHG